jgi:hypothetical protein
MKFLIQMENDEEGAELRKFGVDIPENLWFGGRGRNIRIEVAATPIRNAYTIIGYAGDVTTVSFELIAGATVYYDEIQKFVDNVPIPGRAALPG